MAFLQRYPITQRFLTKPSKRRSGRLITAGVHFVVAHDTGNKNATALQNVSFYETSRDTESASAHIFVDDADIIECIPAVSSPPEKAWHVLYSVPEDNILYGYDANDAAIGIEYCYGDRIHADEAYKRYVWVIARVCDQFQLDPAKSVVGHFFLDPQRRTDPVTGLAFSRRTYEQLLRDIVDEYAACGGSNAPAAIPNSATVTTTVRLNLRSGAPTTRASIARVVEARMPLTYTSVSQGEAVNGNSLWFRETGGDYFWSGGCN